MASKNCETYHYLVITFTLMSSGNMHHILMKLCLTNVNISCSNVLFFTQIAWQLMHQRLAQMRYSLIGQTCLVSLEQLVYDGSQCNQGLQPSKLEKYIRNGLGFCFAKCCFSIYYLQTNRFNLCFLYSLIFSPPQFSLSSFLLMASSNVLVIGSAFICLRQAVKRCPVLLILHGIRSSSVFSR